MNSVKYCLYFFMVIISCTEKQEPLQVEVYETSASGNKLKQITEFSSAKESATIKLLPQEEFQTITGFGGSFTEASAYLLNKLGKENIAEILEAYFGENGAKYSLTTNTHEFM